ncbi:unnamed protein product [Tilletia laevis]|uniref:Extracellular membrane protein CFEM domain-containing protein n=1 Tax=Tilletia controversa TaxID=13291 RepID=A0A8X7SYD7_9BASI|nr:hypothetical protein CF336_g5845 [Tilletia laevis]KAE8202337.1 hypothetical protein CF335_g3454 [Tilletia laevis]KAE8202743.1 hypothetical protein CF328_g2039 [Tilletia controversa]KAE8251999.1 hypothetical protein A4X06_0g2451 [Tilletia controversa]CAD6957492.1 unnamed protein product [Tilletia laevis]
MKLLNVFVLASAILGSAVSAGNRSPPPSPPPKTVRPPPGQLNPGQFCQDWSANKHGPWPSAYLDYCVYCMRQSRGVTSANCDLTDFCKQHAKYPNDCIRGTKVCDTHFGDRQAQCWFGEI